ncbi:hypothetical protein [Umezawaea sp. Da 62-37]|uniref:hypothetical protein n=1 Tax=Umezawaea sp. Da 62-37 TaxID=3075927 RepID=UPI0028F6F50C|nr:hypothetical protein [Umezawaea sp. Da 62-37]WNV84950.1 hypothetical protein RM788_43480 [Umezawaea sp. Da 62-37]
MTDIDIESTLDLASVLAARWADPDRFPVGEFDRAEHFYQQRRRHDAALLVVREKAAALIRTWTGHESRDVGSFGLGLNLEASDLDLGIGYPAEQREVLVAALAGHAVFKGERVTRFPAADFSEGAPATTRLVFAFTVGGVEVDLSALTVEDFAVACRMLDDIEAHMTERERVAHTWVKHLLRSSGRMQDYAE